MAPPLHCSTPLPSQMPFRLSQGRLVPARPGHVGEIMDHDEPRSALALTLPRATSASGSPIELKGTTLGAQAGGWAEGPPAISLATSRRRPWPPDATRNAPRPESVGGSATLRRGGRRRRRREPPCAHRRLQEVLRGGQLGPGARVRRIGSHHLGLGLPPPAGGRGRVPERNVQRHVAVGAHLCEDARLVSLLRPPSLFHPAPFGRGFASRLHPMTLCGSLIGWSTRAG